MPKKIALVVGARPNFMKAAPLMRRLQQFPDRYQPILIHTGQHYDHKMSQLFFDELKMPRPDVYLGVGSGTHAEQTAKIMIDLEKMFADDRPDLVIVFGDVNSTMAAAIVASKATVKLAHVEAGLRSFDPEMPEEINRIVTDRLSDYLFVSEPSGLKNLEDEGVNSEKIYFTGNIMIDTLVHNLKACEGSKILDALGLKPGKFTVMTLHRPSNVDDPRTLRELLVAIAEIGKEAPVIFPCHPRTAKEMNRNGSLADLDPKALRVLEPLGYLDFLRLQSQARLVLTDSGGIQEETTYLQIPCLTLRYNTERPVTVTEGTNQLVGSDPVKLRAAAKDILSGKLKQGRIPENWDGHTAERIVEILDKILA
jgi:UDP-N-acetylglucosamine 2-epimerase (non-hydrolysing)